MKKIDSRIQKFKKIITADIYNDLLYEYQDTSLVRIGKIDCNHSNFVLSCLALHDLTLVSMNVDSINLQSPLEDMIYNRVYDEYGLDNDKDYIIEYIKNANDNQGLGYIIGICDTSVLSQMTQNIVTNTGYIDLLVPAPMLYQILYDNNILSRSPMDVFIYFSNNETFVAFYKLGSFIFAKSLGFSIDKIYDIFCNKVDEKISRDIFESMLIKNESNGDIKESYKVQFDEIFENILSQIQEIVEYSKKLFKYDKISHFYFSSQNGNINKIDEFLTDRMGIEIHPLSSSLPRVKNGGVDDILQFLLVHTGLRYLKHPHEYINLTNTQRPPRFLNRSGGQFLSIVGVASLFAIALPLVIYTNAWLMSRNLVKLNEQSMYIEQKVNSVKQTIMQLNDAIAKETIEFDRVSSELQNRYSIIQNIYEKKVKYRLKSEILNSLASDLSRYEIQVYKISSLNDDYEFSLISSDYNKITKFINAVSKKYENDLVNIDIQRIDTNPKNLDINASIKNGGNYRGVLKMSFK